MATTQYIGPRIIPVFAPDVEWDIDSTYDALTMVQHQGETFMSRQFVPVGIQLPDSSQSEEFNDYWVHMSNWNAQVESYRQEVLLYNGRISTLEDDLPIADFDSTNTVKKAIDGLQDQLGSSFDDTNTVSAAVTELQRQDSIRALCFETVSDMAASADLFDGAIAHTNGFHSANDGGAAFYNITDTGTANGNDVIACGALYANLVIEPEMRVEQFGAYGDDAHDDYNAINRACAVCDIVDFNGDSTYLVESTITLNDAKTINGNGCTVKPGVNANGRDMCIFNSTNDLRVFNVEFACHGNQTLDSTQTAYSLINVASCDLLVIEGCKFSNKHDNVTSYPVGLMYERPASCVLAVDVTRTVFKDNYMVGCTGLENIVVCGHVKARETISAVFDNNVFYNCPMTALDFIGGHVVLTRNTYDSTYAGSMVNAFGDYVIVSDEIILGSYGQGYDNTENGNWGGTSIQIENVVCKNAIHNAYDDASFVAGKAKEIMISNVIVEADVICEIINHYTASSEPYAPNANTLLTNVTISDSTLKYRKCVKFELGYSAAVKNAVISNCNLVPTLDNFGIGELYWPCAINVGNCKIDLTNISEYLQQTSSTYVVRCISFGNCSFDNAQADIVILNTPNGVQGSMTGCINSEMTNHNMYADNNPGLTTRGFAGNAFMTEHKPA